MNRVDFPQARGTVGLAWVDITPPVGIYHRMWGAATHERATGVHKPLRSTALYVQPAGREQARLVIALDHCLLEREECQRIAAAVAAATNLAARQVLVTCSHTHAAGLMSRSRADLPGGELIGPYLDDVARHSADAARKAADQAEPATLAFGTGRCSLATNRDFFDAERGEFVCGFRPKGFADDTVLIASIVSGSGTQLGTIVNYACHPTTLAWDNTLVSPDYVGACRETVEAATGAPCLFLQGASGDLGPKVGFVGEPAVADSHGRQLGYAVLSALESFPPVGTRYVYAGPVVSGTAIGTWKYKPVPPEDAGAQASWETTALHVDLAYRADLMSVEECEEARAAWMARESQARARQDAAAARDCRAKVEQGTRQLHRLRQLPKGKYFPLPVQLWRWGDVVWLFVGGEHYQSLQVELRRRFPRTPIVVATLTDDWLPGYVPPASTYGYGIYQESIALVGPGSAEVLLESVSRAMEKSPPPRTRESF